MPLSEVAEIDRPHPVAALRARTDLPGKRWGGHVKLTFMGTAGARFMVAKQLAASGGLYLEDGNTRISLDPGPGAIVQYAKRKVDLTKLDAIVDQPPPPRPQRRRQRDGRGDDRRRFRAIAAGCSVPVGCARRRPGRPQLPAQLPAGDRAPAAGDRLQRQRRHLHDHARATCTRSRHLVSDSATGLAG